MNEMLAVLRNTKVSEVAGILGKMAGVGLLAALIYSYYNVLVEASVASFR